MTFNMVDLPVPAEPYKTINFCIFFESPETIEPMAHSILCLSSSVYKVDINVSQAEISPASKGYGNFLLA